MRTFIIKEDIVKEAVIRDVIKIINFSIEFELQTIVSYNLL